MLTDRSPVIIFGPGYTGSRLARSLLSRKIQVFALGRNPQKLAALANAGATTCSLQACLLNAEILPKNALIVYSIPPLPEDEAEPIHSLVAHINPQRVVYISSTSIYGSQLKIDRKSPVELSNNRGRGRMRDEAFLSAGPWSALMLRPAAIYGPNRGVHVRVRQGLVPRGTGTTVTSRIHVDDLVQLIEAALESTLEGAWPVADEYPCPTMEIVEWCAQRLGMTLNMASATGASEEGRAVDGSAIFQALGVKLLWPTWKTGIPASLREEDLQEEDLTEEEKNQTANGAGVINAI